MPKILDPVGQFVKDIIYAQDHHRFGGKVRSPNSHLDLVFLGFDDSHPIKQVTPFTPDYYLAVENSALWRTGLLPCYGKLEPHLGDLGEDGHRFRKWMEKSAATSHKAQLHLEGYRLKFGGVDQETLNLVNIYRRPIPTYSQRIHFGRPIGDPVSFIRPLQRRGVPPNIRELMRCEKRALVSSGRLHCRTLELFHATGIVHLGSNRDLPSTYFRSSQLPAPILKTPQQKIAALMGCLGFLASAVPVCLLMYQLSETDSPFEVTKDFVKNAAISSLIPSLPAALAFEGVKWMFS